MARKLELIDITSKKASDPNVLNRAGIRQLNRRIMRLMRYNGIQWQGKRPLPDDFDYTFVTNEGKLALS